MKVKELREKSPAELAKHALVLKEKIQKAHFSKVTDGSGDHFLIAKLRKELAQTLTLITAGQSKEG